MSEPINSDRPTVERMEVIQVSYKRKVGEGSAYTTETVRAYFSKDGAFLAERKVDTVAYLSGILSSPSVWMPSARNTPSGQMHPVGTKPQGHFRSSTGRRGDLWDKDPIVRGQEADEAKKRVIKVKGAKAPKPKAMRQTVLDFLWKDNIGWKSIEIAGELRNRGDERIPLFDSSAPVRPALTALKKQGKVYHDMGKWWAT